MSDLEALVVAILLSVSWGLLAAGVVQFVDWLERRRNKERQ